MTFLAIKTIKQPHKRLKRILVLRCDFCQIEYEVCFNQNVSLKDFHFCSRKCAANSDQRKTKTKETNLKRFGAENIWASEQGKNSIRKTNLERYGVDFAGQSEIAKENSKKTCLEKYGVEFSLQAPEIRKKIKQTLIKNYGVDSTLKIQEIHVKGIILANSNESRQKAKQTCIKNFGVEYPCQNSMIQCKASKKRNNSTILFHWLTKEELVCVGSYEVAFVTWCNMNEIDFDWQISFMTPILTPKGNTSVYIIDAFVKSGEFANTWIEIKGREIKLEKWKWFHSVYPCDSQLWNFSRLKELGIL